MARAAVDRPVWQLVASKRGVLLSLWRSDFDRWPSKSVPLACGRVLGSFDTYNVSDRRIGSTKLLCHFSFLATYHAVMPIFNNACSMGKS